MHRGSSRSFLQYCRPQNRGTFFMVAVLGVFIAVVFFAFIAFGNAPKSESTLRFLSVIHRHGDRTPFFTYPKDPYKDDSFWPEGRGALTNRGRLCLYTNGQLLRERYQGFLPEKYKPSESYIFSSPVDRCIMSTEALFAGLYPPVGDQIWNPNLLWQPVSLHPIPNEIDDMLLVKKPCPRLQEENKQVENGYLKTKLEENKDYLIYLSNNTGLDIKAFVDLEYLQDNLLVVKERGLKLPDWVTKDDEDTLLKLSRVSTASVTHTPTLKKLMCGVWINDIIENMKKKTKVNEKFDRLLTVYSAHDISIVNFWRSLNIIQELQKPNYGATIIIELHDVNGNYRVKILYKNHGMDKDLMVLNINGCEDNQDQMCSLDNFEKALSSVIIKDFEKECKISQ